MSTDEPHSRAEYLRRAFEDEEVRRQQQILRWLMVGVLLVIPILSALSYLLVVGYQRHIVEVRRGPESIIFESRQSPFTVEPLRDEGETMISMGGSLTPIHDRLRGEKIQPRFYDAAPYASTEQIITLPQGETTCQIVINDDVFLISGQEVFTGSRRWLIPRGGTLRINVDQLPAPSPEEIDAAMPEEELDSDALGDEL